MRFTVAKESHAQRGRIDALRAEMAPRRVYPKVSSFMHSTIAFVRRVTECGAGKGASWGRVRWRVRCGGRVGGGCFCSLSPQE